MGTWHSTVTLETSEFDYKGQNTSHWGVIYIIGKLLKCRCLKWARMTHLDICNTSYGKKKGRESNCQFDSLPRKVGNRPKLVHASGVRTSLESSQQELKLCIRPHPDQRLERGIIVPQSCESPNLGSFRIPPWESRDKKPFGCKCRREAQRILYRGRWWLPPSPGYGESYESEVTCGLS
jgi:hypothetical protein